ncbi:uncharacterized protein [Temnothorax nylanderi]|uniref:uncharacterized protein isoform X3 n=1 Tax=Temnothorax nylanderi TaxID=102681 RepID=UPI003A8AEC54
MTDTEEAEQAQASTSQSASETDCDTPWPAYSEIFTFEPKLSNEKNFAFTCKLCLGRKVYQANKTSTSNLRKHSKISKKFKQFYPMFYVESNVQHRIIKHPRYLEKIDEAKSNKLANNKRQKENEDISNNSVTKRQCVLQKWGSGITGITQKKLDGAILRFVIENIQPLAVVESPAFIDLVKMGLPSSFRIMCRKTLRAKLCQLYFDMKTALENELAKIEYISTTADLWSKAKRWNSTFDSVCQLMTLLKDGPEKVNQCLDYCNLPRLTNDEIKFLDEYCQVMEPLAKALDILQGDTGMYMGYLLPVLYSLQEKLDNITNTNKLTHCNPLITAIEEGLNRRFCTTFEKKELIIASCLHPKFKLNWLIGEKKKLAESYLEDLLGIRSNDNSPNSGKNDDYDDFFTFHRQSTSTSESGEEELQRFLKSKRTDIELLNDFPKLKKLFIKFNTALPSSASVERMFSIGNSVCQPSRGRLHDNIMEYQLLLKINQKYR